MNHGCSVMVMIHNCLGKSKVNLVVLTMKFAMAMLMNLAHLFLSLVSILHILVVKSQYLPDNSAAPL
ncbi:hypothetical protein ES332_A04G184400v1 [Gossypium tomentosum]|uniref:Uncharacterized protein n=1 Tax=Gossypium tomentosum TaxID=34277 RepID=A0A5D2R1M6_GOSTO|nr:hypothetical protein ES332_A04G184400v1 [Gossypium tomentosum]